MDPVGLLSSLNKIGLFAFLITLGFLIYEVVLLTKTKKTGTAPQVPQFNEGDPQYLSQTKTIPVVKTFDFKNFPRNNKIILIGLTILLVFFGGITLIGSISGLSKSGNSGISPTGTSSPQTGKKVVVPTGIVMVNKSPTLKAEVSASIASEEPTPTEIYLAQADSVIPTGSYLPSPTEEFLPITLSPTVISELPVTSYINNLLILFSVSAIFLFFAFLF